MIWQDLLIMVGGFVLSISLIPTIRGTSKPPIASSLPIALVLASFALAFGTLGLWASMIAMVVQSTTWWILFAQRIRNQRGQ